ncbi:GNAT family N-acetyltransferase [Dictyobacter arantiisoli]|uniref:Uncharacterized protein n=1 Tax=Dictyobacter arantiisoli TaxID=2014874 RepID=A0A5A5T617_9CHLR|nr:GNAT family N-acetyltransferase [Dictyobacter arantiisoli]GCF06880.1 hypothetical protein KDI_04440 [Dictyobacter arantiisoli]
MSITTTTNKAAAEYRQELEDGLIIRWSTAADTENIARITGIVFREKAEDPPNKNIQKRVRMLMHGLTPVMGPDDYAIVEDPRQTDNPVVAGISLQRLDWHYDNIPIQVGRPEIVFTHPDYRNRGLIRQLFDMVHARSAAEGRLLEGITGIPYFYRQFGYEYAIELEGNREVALTSIPKLKESEHEDYTIRTAMIEDLPRIQELYHQLIQRYLVATHIPEADLRWFIEDWQKYPAYPRRFVFQVIVDATQIIRGFMLLPTLRRSPQMNVWTMATDQESNTQAMMTAILRSLQVYGQQLPTEKPDMEPVSAIRFNLGEDHPVYDALGSLARQIEPSYGWYIRVPDLPRLLQHIAPALERRLVGSVVANYSGELKLDFYRSGLHLVFEQGKLVTAENWRSTVLDYAADGGFPPLVFLKALFGYRSLAELRHMYPDVWVNNEVLFNTLFPTKPSYVLSL